MLSMPGMRVINQPLISFVSKDLTCSKQKFKSLIVSKTKLGVFSGSMFSMFLEEGKNECCF